MRRPIERWNSAYLCAGFMGLLLPASLLFGQEGKKEKENDEPATRPAPKADPVRLRVEPARRPGYAGRRTAGAGQIARRFQLVSVITAS